MNVVMIEPMNCQDERLVTSKEHKVAMALHSLTSTAGLLFEMSSDPEYRDIMIKDLGQISDSLLALNLVWERVKAREDA